MSQFDITLKPNRLVFVIVPNTLLVPFIGQSVQNVVSLRRLTANVKYEPVYSVETAHDYPIFVMDPLPGLPNNRYFRACTLATAVEELKAQIYAQLCLGKHSSWVAVNPVNGIFTIDGVEVSMLAELIQQYCPADMAFFAKCMRDTLPDPTVRVTTSRVSLDIETELENLGNRLHDIFVSLHDGTRDDEEKEGDVMPKVFFECGDSVVEMDSEGVAIDHDTIQLKWHAFNLMRESLHRALSEVHGAIHANCIYAAICSYYDDMPS